MTMVPLSRADLHIHSNHSDGTASVAAILARAAAAGLQTIAITDHDTISGALAARRLAREFGVEVVVGEEVSTAEGHLLALFLEHELPPGRPAAETIAAAHAQGGLCVAAHPYDRSTPSLGAHGMLARCAAGEWQLDAIEGLNAGVLWHQRGSNLAARHAALALGLPIVAGSDAHSLATLGQAYTLFPGAGAGDLYRAIVAGQVGWGGGCWTLGHYLDVCQQWIAQRGPLGLLRLALDGAGITRRQPAAPEGFAAARPIEKEIVL